MHVVASVVVVVVGGGGYHDEEYRRAPINDRSERKIGRNACIIPAEVRRSVKSASSSVIGPGITYMAL